MAQLRRFDECYKRDRYWSERLFETCRGDWGRRGFLASGRFLESCQTSAEGDPRTAACATLWKAVLSPDYLDRIPRRYMVEAGKTLEDDAWKADEGPYDLAVYGSNSFFRSFAGATSAGLEVQVDYNVKGDTIHMQLRNAGKQPVEVKIVANAYRTDGPQTVSVAPNATNEQSWKLTDSGNWYDFTVSVSGFERRFAGRMENGKNLLSDPAMAT